MTFRTSHLAGSLHFREPQTPFFTLAILPAYPHPPSRVHGAGPGFCISDAAPLATRSPGQTLQAPPSSLQLGNLQSHPSNPNCPHPTALSHSPGPDTGPPAPQNLCTCPSSPIPALFFLSCSIALASGLPLRSSTWPRRGCSPITFTLPCSQLSPMAPWDPSLKKPLPFAPHLGGPMWSGLH